jgi:hypothetical protein
MDEMDVFGTKERHVQQYPRIHFRFHENLAELLHEGLP